MLNPDFRDMLSAFIEEAAEFLVVGAYAMAAHGVPRATGDLDFWIRASSDNAERVLRALRAFGAPTQDLTAHDLTTPSVVFQIGTAPRRIDILTSIDGVDFDAAWAERMVAEIDGLTVPVLGRAHLIANKKAVDRPQDRADVSAMEDQARRGVDKGSRRP